MYTISCVPIETLRQQIAIRPQSPRSKYEQSLRSADLENTALGREWLAAGKRALSDSLLINMPFKETGYFSAERPAAIGYRVHAKHGETIVVTAEVQSSQPARMFIDLFEVNPADRSLTEVAHADSSRLSYEVLQDRTYLIRLQPELLRSGRYTMTVIGKAMLLFPVQGKTSNSVESFFGAPRDGGKRLHEGIDIAAPKGTPVLASVDGYISSVNEGGLGGKTIWLRDNKRGQSIYYAHLDQQLVSVGKRVRAGDTIGLVGNTGNAQYTGPHLHFGVHRAGSMVDPYPFVKQPLTKTPEITAKLDHLGKWMRVAAKTTSLCLSPHSEARILVKLPKHTPVQVFAGAGNWYRALTPDGLTGYVTSAVLETVNKPLQNQKLKKAAPILDEPFATAAVIDSVQANASVSVLAKYGQYSLVKFANDRTGWLNTKDLPGSKK